MLLNTYYKLIAYSNMCMARTYGENITTLTFPQLKTCNGTYITQTSCSRENYCLYLLKSPFAAPYKGMLPQTTNWSTTQTTSCPLANLIIGSGTTPPVATDYQLEQELYTDIQYIALNTITDTNDGTILYEKTMKNNRSEEITVSEIGLTWPISTSTSYSNYNAYQILVYREVLNTPLVVGPGETFTISITHQFTMPT